MIEVEDDTANIIEATKYTEMQKLEEVKRHNKVMEELVKYQAATSKLEYKMKLFDFYDRLKKENGKSDTEILELFPEIKVFIDI